jgi:hypothetical protein
MESFGQENLLLLMRYRFQCLLCPDRALVDDPSLGTDSQTIPREAAGMPSSAPSTLTIPAGTRVMMVLKSPLHTTLEQRAPGFILRCFIPVVQAIR